MATHHWGIDGTIQNLFILLLIVKPLKTLSFIRMRIWMLDGLYLSFSCFTCSLDVFFLVLFLRSETSVEMFRGGGLSLPAQAGGVVIGLFKGVLQGQLFRPSLAINSNGGGLVLLLLVMPLLPVWHWLELDRLAWILRSCFNMCVSTTVHPKALDLVPKDNHASPRTVPLLDPLLAGSFWGDFWGKLSIFENRKFCFAEFNECN